MSSTARPLKYLGQLAHQNQPGQSGCSTDSAAPPKLTCTRVLHSKCKPVCTTNSHSSRARMANFACHHYNSHATPSCSFIRLFSPGHVHCFSTCTKHSATIQLSTLIPTYSKQQIVVAAAMQHIHSTDCIAAACSATGMQAQHLSHRLHATAGFHCSRPDCLHPGCPNNAMPYTARAPPTASYHQHGHSTGRHSGPTLPTTTHTPASKQASHMTCSCCKKPPSRPSQTCRTHHHSSASPAPAPAPASSPSGCHSHPQLIQPLFQHTCNLPHLHTSCQVLLSRLEEAVHEGGQLEF